MDDGSTVERLVGVYDADGTVLGELSYFLRARIGRAPCALCDVTHGRLRERADWRACRDQLPVPFATCRRDDQPDAVRVATGARAPVGRSARVTDRGRSRPPDPRPQRERSLEAQASGRLGKR